MNLDKKTTSKKNDSKLVFKKCRIWTINGIAVQRALVTSDWCKAEELLKQKESTFNDNFKGKNGPAEALCCNWTHCNQDLNTAKLESQTENDDLSNSFKANGPLFAGLITLIVLLILIPSIYCICKKNCCKCSTS